MLNAPIKIELLGHLCITQGSRTINRFRTYKTGVLLAYLAFYSDRAHPREELIELLWPDCDPVLGRNSLSQSLSSLRHQLEPPGTSTGEVLHADRNNVRLVPETFTTDVAKFDEARATFHSAEAEKDRAVGFVTLTQLYRGEFLPGFYEDWNIRERERLKDAFLRVLVDRIDQLESQNDIDSAIECARRASEIDPLDEETHLRLMRLFAATENYGSAIRQFGVLHRTLEQELGVEPSAEAKDLAARLRTKAATHSAEIPEDVSHTSPARQTRRTARQTAPVSGIFAALALEVPDSRSDALLKKLIERSCGDDANVDAGLWTIRFPRATDALECAVAIQRACDKRYSGGQLPPIALHVGETNRSAKSPEQGSLRAPLDQTLALLRSASPGQLLCSEAAAMLLVGNSDPGVKFQDLGSYRVDGSESSQRIYQADYEGRTDSKFAELRADRGYESTLPRHLSRFFGRQNEIDALVRFYSPENEDVRLVTITGPGGTGKTRVSVEAARALEASFRNAAWFIPLAHIAEPRFLPSATFEAMGIQPASGADPVKHLIKVLSRQKSLLVLDNFEHWLSDTSPSVADESRGLVQRLLEQVPTLRCLVTSRRRLGLIGEIEFFLEPLPVPDLRVDLIAEEVVRCESVQLFVDRAQYVRPSFQITDTNAGTIADICRRLEGIPLALELAAAKTQVLTQAQILDGLSSRLDFLEDRRRQTEARHQKLRVTIDWSFNMLAPEAREFFAKLSVFRGGGNLTDVEAICEEPLAMDHLALLQDFSFVIVEENVGASDMRFRLLETLREYGDEKLSPDERDILRKHHVEHFLRVAEDARHRLNGEDQSRWFRHLEQDHQNFLSALDWCVSSGQIETGMKLVCALSPFWETLGYGRLGNERLNELRTASSAETLTPGTAARVALSAANLAMATSDFGRARELSEDSLQRFRELGDAAGEMRALSDVARIAFEQGDYAAAQPYSLQSLELARKLGDDYSVAASLNTLGLVACEQGSYEDAIGRYTEGLELRRKLGDRRGIATQLNNLGVVYRRKGDYERARSVFTEALELQREVGNRRSIAAAFSNLGLIAEHERDYELARSLQEESMQIRREIGDDWGVARSLTILGIVNRHQGDHAAARTLFEEGLSICRRMGNKLGIAQTLCQLGDLIASSENPEECRPFLSESLTLMLELNNKQGLTDVLQSYSRLALVDEQPIRSAKLFFVAYGMRKSIGAKLPPFEQAEVDDQLDTLRSGLSPAEIKDSEKKGRKLSVEQAVEISREI